MSTIDTSNISDRLIDLVKRREGLELKAYLPTKNDVPTIGFGTTVYSNGRRVKLGDVITQQQAEQELRTQLAKFQSFVVSKLKVPVNQNQLDALTSLAYNIGQGAFANSTLLKKVNSGDFLGAEAEFSRWVKQGSKTLNGLVTRRAEEAKLFSSPFPVAVLKAK